MKQVCVLIPIVWMLGLSARALDPPLPSPPPIPTDIESAFMVLPGERIHPSPPEVFQEDRRSWIDLVDRRNGYLKFSGKAGYAWEGYGECAWFTRRGASPIIAVSVLSCGPACEQTLRFLEIDSDGWRDVTTMVFEPPSAERIRTIFSQKGGPAEFAGDPPVVYQLPRFGTSIELQVQEQVVGKRIVLGVVRLKDGRFIFDSKR